MWCRVEGVQGVVQGVTGDAVLEPRVLAVGMGTCTLILCQRSISHQATTEHCTRHLPVSICHIY